METSIKVSAPGKVILAGEHAAVYGFPALAAAIDKRLSVSLVRKNVGPTIIKTQAKNLSLVKFALKLLLKAGETVDLTIDSDLPEGGGLGSSAALATALTVAFLPQRSWDYRNKIIKKIEDFQHGNSSGLDQTIVREGGVLFFQKKHGFKKITLKFPKMILINSGAPTETTGDMVKIVSQGNWQQEFSKIGQLVINWSPEKIKANEMLLEKIGVVGNRAQKMVRQIESVGGMAKVCGAGGVETGSGMLLGYHQNIDRLIELTQKNHWEYWPVVLGTEGVKNDS